MKASHLTLRIPAELEKILDRLARTRKIPKSQIVREAVMGYLASPLEESRGGTLTGRELAEKWTSIPKLDPDEAEDLSRDVVRARNELPRPKSAWK